MSTESIRREKAARREVIEMIPGFWGWCVLSGVVHLLIQLIGLIPTLLMRQVVDVFIPGGQMREVVLFIVLLCGIPVLSSGLNVFYKYFLFMLIVKKRFQLSAKGFQQVMAQAMAFFDSNNAAELASYCNAECKEYIVFWLEDLPQVVATGISGLIILGYVFSLHWGLACILLLYFPIAFLPSNWFGKHVQKWMGDITRGNAKLAQLMTDTFRGIKVVKALGLEQDRLAGYRRISREILGIFRKVTIFDCLDNVWAHEFTVSLFSGLVFGISAFLIILGWLTLGSMVVIVNYTSQFMNIARQSISTIYYFQSQMGRYDKLFELLTMPVPAGRGQKAFSFKDQIQFRQVRFRYETSRGDVLKSLDLTVRPGEWLGIVGASGAGKSTLFELLLRFYSPQEGAITVDGVPLEEIEESSLRAGVGLVSQSTVLFPGTIRDNLRLAAPDASDETLDQILRQVHLGRFLEEHPAGLDTEIGDGGLLLSGGERQKIGLAQGLLRRCPLILLDEVTANVDGESEAEIRNTLKSLKDETGVTVIAISHRPDFLEQADRVVRLEDGKVSEV